MKTKTIKLITVILAVNLIWQPFTLACDSCAERVFNTLMQLRQLALLERESRALEPQRGEFSQDTLVRILIKRIRELVESIAASGNRRVVVAVEDGKIIEGELVSHDVFTVTAKVKGKIFSKQVEISDVNFLLLNKYMHKGRIEFLGQEHRVLGMDKADVLFDTGKVALTDVLPAVLLSETENERMAYDLIPHGGGVMIFVLHNKQSIYYTHAPENMRPGTWSLIKHVNGQEVARAQTGEQLFRNVSVLMKIGPRATIERLDECFLSPARTLVANATVGDSIMFGGQEANMTLGKEGRNFVLIDSEGGKVVLKRGRNTIGRHGDNDVVISVPAVSRQHAEVIVSPIGEVRIYDLKSSNRTWLMYPRVRSRAQELEFNRLMNQEVISAI